MTQTFRASIVRAWLASTCLLACTADDPASEGSTDNAGTGSAATGAGSGGSAPSTAGSSGSTSSGSAAGGGGSAAGASGSAGSAGTTPAASAGSSAAGSAGQAGRGGSGGSGAAGTAEPDAGSGGNAGSGGTGGSAAPTEHFSFFVASLAGMQKLSGSEDGFGGDLRHGEADGLAGADKICSELAEASLPGAAAKQWRAFLSITKGPDGKPVNAISRIGAGPWYDRLGRLVAMTTEDLKQTRPRGADPAIVDNLPNEDGVPNMTPNPAQGPVDNHHVLTGSNDKGELYGQTSTCADWTSTAKTSGRPRIGFSWPAGGRVNWISGQDEGGCGAGVSLSGNAGSDPSNPIVGSGGGYGGIYCFALMP